MTSNSFPLYLSDRFTRAVDYARHLHIETRKGTGAPAMAHLLGVASLVMGETGRTPFPITEDMGIAAILHDAVEDHGGLPRLRDIDHNFGPDVARMVKGLSDSLEADPTAKAAWEERKAAYVKRLWSEPGDVQLISIADKLYNARSMVEDYRQVGPELWARFKRSREQQLRYFHDVLAVFQAKLQSRMVAEFERAVTELEALTAK